MRKGKRGIGGLALTISEVYAAAVGGQLDNESLYVRVAAAAGIDKAELDAVTPIGKAGVPRSPIKRRIRWFQQDLVKSKVIERVSGTRGVWRLTDVVGQELEKATSGVKLIAFCTDLGIAVWGSCQDVFKSFNEPISLIISSPPYPLRSARAYGGISDEVAYVDFICSAIEPVVRALMPGGSVVLNARLVAERMRKSVQEADLRGVTLSIGLTLVVPGDSSESAAKRADAAMYSAKINGKNGVAG